MKNLINDIEIGGVRDALNILAKAGTEDLFEKAKHQIGDSHPKWPQLKWTDLGGGKFGWRTGTGKGKRGNTNTSSGDNGGSNSGEQKDLSTHAKETDTKTLKNVANSDKAPKELKDAAKKELQNRGEETDKQSKSTVKYSPNMRKLIDAFRFSSNKYTDPEKMSITTTPKGNWELRYDGKRVSVIDSLDIDRDEFDDLGITINSGNTSLSDKEKLRPVGTGTNGPERRKKEAPQAKPAKTEKDVPYENLNTADEVITYAKTLSDFTFKDEESGVKNGRAFSLTNKNGLKMIVDFVNNSEYIYNFEDKDGNILYRMMVTRINNETNWKDKLNPKTWSRQMISATESRISKYKANAKRAKNRYEYYRKTSDYDKYLKEDMWAQRESHTLEKIKKIAELS